jgi:GDP-D-mannose 3', 5'-epimerase
MKTALVLGAGGFIGSHMVNRLKSEGYWVRGVDLKYPDFSKSEADEFLIYDLRDPRNVDAVVRLYYNSDECSGPNRIPIPFTFLMPAFAERFPFDEVYQFAADMGGAGYIFTGEHDADVMHNSATINLNVCHWAKEYGVKKLFYSSSACMYPQGLQKADGLFTHRTFQCALSESMAYPADPDSEYGWEKLFSERLYLAYKRNYGLNVRIARFHNIYGPEGTYAGGKEKAPAAMCRKVIEWDGNHIDVWGTGKQTRSFLYIEDCIDAVRLLMESDFKEPINIGSEEMVSINELAAMAISHSGNDIEIKNIDGPVGVMGRNSDNTLIRKVLNWEPKFSLKEGLEKTYFWIKSQYEK